MAVFVECIKLAFYPQLARNFGGEKLWRIWQFATDMPKLYPPIACNISKS